MTAILATPRREPPRATTAPPEPRALWLEATKTYDALRLAYYAETPGTPRERRLLDLMTRAANREWRRNPVTVTVYHDAVAAWLAAPPTALAGARERRMRLTR